MNENIWVAGTGRVAFAGVSALLLVRPGGWATAGHLSRPISMAITGIKAIVRNNSAEGSELRNGIHPMPRNYFMDANARSCRLPIASARPEELINRSLPHKHWRGKNRDGQLRVTLTLPAFPQLNLKGAFWGAEGRIGRGARIHFDDPDHHGWPETSD
jgi:hypothetical protein